VAAWVIRRLLRWQDKGRIEPEDLANARGRAEFEAIAVEVGDVTVMRRLHPHRPAGLRQEDGQRLLEQMAMAAP